jgi:hypothetical protein
MLTPDILSAAGIGIVVIVAGIGNYLLKYRQASQTPPLSTSATMIGMELGNRHQVEQLIGEVRRIGDILEGKKQASIEGQLTEILERLEQTENRRR